MHATEIACLVCIHTQIELSRRRLGEPAFHIHLLVNLMDIVDLQSQQYTINQLHSTKNDFLSSFQPSMLDCIVSMQYISQNLMIQSLDDLMTFFQNISNIIATTFEDTCSNTSDENIYGPNIIHPKSLLGYFVRSLLVKWENLDFYQVCMVYDKYKLFISDASPTMSSSQIEIPRENIVFESRVMEGFVQCRDVYSALDTSHELFDTTTFSIPSKKHQYAMLSQSSIFLNNRLETNSILSLEELIKMAQNRQDNETLAHALEMLYHTTINAQQLPSSSASQALMSRYASPEKYLVLSVHKYMESGQRVEACKGALQLVRHLTVHTQRDNLHCELSYLWMLLQAAILGEMRTVKSVMNASTISVAWGLLSSTAESTLAKTDAPLCSEEYAECAYLLTMVTAQMWVANDKSALAVLALQRYLAAAPAETKPEQIVSVVCLLARIKCRRIWIATKRLSADVDYATTLIAGLQALKTESVDLIRDVRFTEALVTTTSLVISGRWSEAWINVGVLMQMVDESYVSLTARIETRLLGVFVLFRVNEWAARRLFAEVEADVACSSVARASADVARALDSLRGVL